MQQMPLDSAEARVEIAAPVAKVWELVGDPLRCGDWSPENLGGRWLDGATRPALGARFRGTNRRGLAWWYTNCTVVRYEPERAIAWEVRVPWGGPPLSRWTYELAPSAAGTEVTERWELLNASALTRATWVLVAGSPAARVAMLKASLATSLGKLKSVLERDVVAAGEGGQA
ncbi:MAG TPA: SRPBCC family protein [Egibacteraceae bacterium]|nr:SRPBCC family protein [Egibacteraceae bacterium]